MRKTMVEMDYPQLSIRAQCDLLDVNRNRLETKPRSSWQPGPKHPIPLQSGNHNDLSSGSL